MHTPPFAFEKLMYNSASSFFFPLDCRRSLASLYTSHVEIWQNMRSKNAADWFDFESQQREANAVCREPVRKRIASS